MEVLGQVLGMLIALCYQVLHNYVLAIAAFTLLTKVILFPVSMWMQKNSIKMVQLTPELNQLKVKYYGDKDTIAEETQALYKQKGYHPLASTLPMFIQLILLIGVIGAVRSLLEGDTSTILGQLPSDLGGVAWLMPLAAGVAALMLGLAQNHNNPLQREQNKAEQWMTNGVSIGISLVLGAFVPLGVGIYWICSNLFTILQQLILNLVIPPEKYINYEALRVSQEKLKEISNLGQKKRSKEEKQREKQDYKRFFSIANKHLVIYSESSGFYKYFQNMIEQLILRSNVIIHYITSDPNDQIFDIARQHTQIHPYYIGEKKLITLMMKMDADIVVMTMPDLDNYHIKRSYVRKDIEYIYVFHGVISGLRTLRPAALDHFDTLLTVGDYQEKEIRQAEALTGGKKKKLVPCGYGVVDNMAAAYEAQTIQKHDIPHILIAPSWQADNILESCLLPLLKSLKKLDCVITVRPHPQYLRRFQSKFEAIIDTCKDLLSDRVIIEKDFSSNQTVFSADLLITDWSSIGYEYALATKKPVLFIDTPMKIVNPQMEAIEHDTEPFDLQMRKILGISLLPEQVEEEGVCAAQKLLDQRALYSDIIEQVRQDHIYNFGESGKYAASYILNSLKGRKK